MVQTAPSILTQLLPVVVQAKLIPGILVMALQAVAFDEPRRPHRENPMVVVEPTVLAGPLVLLAGVVRRVRRPRERRAAALSVVANGAADVLQWMRT